jgi:hypothetical protein
LRYLNGRSEQAFLISEIHREPVSRDGLGLFQSDTEIVAWKNLYSRSPLKDKTQKEDAARGYKYNFETLVKNLQKAGWSKFAPGEFVGLQFESIGKANVAKNNWFALLKPLPVLDSEALFTWNTNYQTFIKKTPAGFFYSGKYFVLMLLAETMGADAIAALSQEAQIQ